MPKARPRNNVLEDMTRSEAEKIIYEANLGSEDTNIARLYLIDKMPQVDIAAELEMDRKTVCTRLSNIVPKLQHAVDKCSS